jgi:hypothetical protein
MIEKIRFPRSLPADEALMLQGLQSLGRGRNNLRAFAGLINAVKGRVQVLVNLDLKGAGINPDILRIRDFKASMGVSSRRSLVILEGIPGVSTARLGLNDCSLASDIRFNNASVTMESGREKGVLANEIPAGAIIGVLEPGPKTRIRFIV